MTLWGWTNCVIRKRSPIRFTEFINRYLSKVKITANAEAWFSSIDILTSSVFWIDNINTKFEYISPYTSLSPMSKSILSSQTLNDLTFMVPIAWRQNDFHGDIVALNDNETTFISNFYCIQTYSKCQEVNVSNDVINDIVFTFFFF